MNTNGATTVLIMEVQDLQGINTSFNAKTALPIGAPVKIENDGTVSLATGTDKVVGIVTVPAKAAGKRVTVITHFAMIAQAKATAAIADGAAVEAVAIDADGLHTTYKTLATANAAPVGLAIRGAAAAGDIITVGLF